MDEERIRSGNKGGFDALSSGPLERRLATLGGSGREKMKERQVFWKFERTFFVQPSLNESVGMPALADFFDTFKGERRLRA